VPRDPLTATMPSCAANLLRAENKWPASFLRDPPGCCFAETRIGIEPGANRGASDRQRVNPGEGLAYALERLVELRDPAGDQLTKCERRRVLKVRPPHYDNVAISAGFLVEDVAEPASWIARLAMTSLAFMLVCVPEPVWNTTRGNSSSHRPSITSCAARTIRSPFL
jgi:hypothetical protein